MSIVTPRSWALRQTVRGIAGAKAVFLLALTLAGLALTIPVFLGTLAWALGKPIYDVPVSTEITVFTSRSAGDESVAAVREKIGGMPEVESVILIPKADALEQVNRSLGLSAKAGTTNPLPDILVATVAKNVAGGEIADLAEVIGKIENVDSVAFDGKWAENVSALISAVSVTMVILGSVVISLVLLVIAASVRLTMNARRDEIRLLYVLGATDTFIRRPYVWRGFITLGLAAVVSLAISAAGIGLLSRPVANFAAIYGVTADLYMPAADWCALYVIAAAFLGAFIGSFAARDAIREAHRF